MNKYTFSDKKIWGLFVKPGEVIEVRILGASGNNNKAWVGYSKGVVAGYFDDHEEFCKSIKAIIKVPGVNVYFTLQVIDPRLIGRACNRLKALDQVTTDQWVKAYRWLPVDIDPRRPKGISSSDLELRQALELRDRIAEYVVEKFDFSKPLKAVSGNGGHLLFGLPDMPVPEGKPFVKDVLCGLAQQFDTFDVEVDQTVYNPSRIWKLYGTIARKGDHVLKDKNREARPHRQAYIDDLGDY